LNTSISSEATKRHEDDVALNNKIEHNYSEFDTFSKSTTEELNTINASITEINSQLSDAVTELNQANTELSSKYETNLAQATQKLVKYVTDTQDVLMDATTSLNEDSKAIWTAISTYIAQLNKYSQTIVVTSGFNHTLTPTVVNPSKVTIDLKQYGITYDDLTNVDLTFGAASIPAIATVSGSGSTLTVSLVPTENRFDSQKIILDAITLSVSGSANSLQDATPSTSDVTFPAWSSINSNGGHETGGTYEDGVVHDGGGSSSSSDSGSSSSSSSGTGTGSGSGGTPTHDQKPQGQ